MVQLKKLTLVALGALALAACDQNRDAPAGTVVDHWDTSKLNVPGKGHGEVASKGDGVLVAPTAKGGGPAAESNSFASARDRVAALRCEHYQSCGDVASGKKYDTMDSCVTREKADIDKSWASDKCGKVDQARLDTCLAKMHEKKCGAIFTTFPGECDQDKVCIDTRP